MKARKIRTMDREGNVVDVLGLKGKQGANGTTPHIGENGNWFIGDTDTGVPAKGEGGGSGGGILAETDPTVFVWAKSHLPFTDAQLSAMASGAGFVVNPTNFADGKTYFRYHAGATSFTWTNPNPQRGAVTITVLAWSQYGDKTAANAFSALNIVYGDGTTGRLSLVNGQTVTMTTDAGKVLTEIRGNYDHENWVLLDMDVLTIAADYPAPTGTVKSVNGEKPDEDGNVQIPIPEGGAGASVMVGATSDTDGASGLVPAPAAGDEGKFLAGDGTWKTPASSGGGTDLSLGVSGAAVGQTVRITAVDEGGKPTAWEAVVGSNGYNNWRLIQEITVEEAVSDIWVTEDTNGDRFELSRIAILVSNCANGKEGYEGGNVGARLWYYTIHPDDGYELPNKGLCGNGFTGNKFHEVIIAAGKYYWAEMNFGAVVTRFDDIGGENAFQAPDNIKTVKAFRLGTGNSNVNAYGVGTLIRVWGVDV